MSSVDGFCATLAARHTRSRSCKDNKKVHTINTDQRIIFETKVNMFLDTESKVSGGRKVGFFQLILFDLETTFKDLLGFWTANGNVNGNLFIAANGEGTDSITSF